MGRRLPIYILIDTSGSMKGEPIEAVKSGLRALLASLRKDPFSLETVWLSVITYDREARIVVPLSEVATQEVPDFPEPETSPTNLGEALQLLCDRYDNEVRSATFDQKGDWLPYAIVMTDGKPTDTAVFNRAVERIKTYRFAKIIGLAAGPKAKVEPLKQFSNDVYSLDTMDVGTFSKFWEWVSTVAQRQSCAPSRDANELPPPPDEIQPFF